MARLNLARVAVSVTTLDNDLARSMEPRASSPGKRLDTLQTLHKAGVPTTVMTAPMIPALNDHELEAILGRAAEMGACYAGMVLIRLPLEIEGLFTEWLANHAPGRAGHVMNLIRQAHGGQAYRSDWGLRQTGDGPYVEIMRQRFIKACTRLNLNRERPPLDCSRFTVPPAPGQQINLF